MKSQEKPRSTLQKAAPSPHDLFPLVTRQIDLNFVLDSGLGVNEFTDQCGMALIVRALEKTKGNQTEAAKLLKINRSTLIMRIFALKQRGLKPEAYEFKD